MTSFSVALEPQIAELVRAKATLPHQRNPPSEWFAIQYLVAVRLGTRTWFSDGRRLWESAEDAWDVTADPELAGLIASGRHPARAFPLGALTTDRMVWGFRYYDTDHTYVWTPLVLDAAHRTVQVLHASDGSRIGGTSPRTLLLGPDNAASICGEVDAGAIFHLDDFIMVDVAWDLDLEAGTFRQVANARGTLSRGLVAVGREQLVGERGTKWTATADELSFDDGNGWRVGVRRGDEALILDLRTFTTATVSVRPYADAIQEASASPSR